MRCLRPPLRQCQLFDLGGEQCSGGDTWDMAGFWHNAFTSCALWSQTQQDTLVAMLAEDRWKARNAGCHVRTSAALSL